MPIIPRDMYDIGLNTLQYIFNILAKNKFIFALLIFKQITLQKTCVR